MSFALNLNTPEGQFYLFALLLGILVVAVLAIEIGRRNRRK